MNILALENGLAIEHNGKQLLYHSPDNPAFFVGIGHEKMDMYRGNFNIEDYLEARTPLIESELIKQEKKIRLKLSRYSGDKAQLILVINELEDGVSLQIESLNPFLNRFWIRLNASHDEKIWGCGEQMSYFNLRGRHFPLWTSEPGVGRDKNTYVTWKSDVENKGGGDYYHTNYPQPTYISSQRYFCHIETTCYADFDFRNTAFHELHTWEIPKEILLRSAPTYIDLVSKISAYFGRQPRLPEWIYNGVILGLKRGEEHALEKLQLALDNHVAVSAIWCEDWAGIRETSFGTRLFWDWKWRESRYPNLDTLIPDLQQRDIKFLAYANPYLCVDGDFFPIAEEKGYFATNDAGNTAIVDFGEFECGVVDFTNPDAYHWFKSDILQKEMLDFGISGWMADFGEYLPIDVHLYNGVSAKEEHNFWPVRWAQVNAEAIAERGKTDDVTFFMRAGYAGFQRYCPQLWAGDQSVDFSRHDGLVTVISAALSSGLMGNAYHHSDIGGYTSLFGNNRSDELLKRWTEMAAFTPMMRSHETNRPSENIQWFDNPSQVKHLAAMSQVYRHLTPYLRTLVDDAETNGTPVQRPLFLHFEEDPRCYDIQDQYLYGPDVLVAPVYKAERSDWTVYLPNNQEWIHCWTGETFKGGQEVTVAAPVGQPPVFYKSTSQWVDLFAGLAELKRHN